MAVKTADDDDDENAIDVDLQQLKDKQPKNSKKITAEKKIKVGCLNELDVHTHTHIALATNRSSCQTKVEWLGEAGRTSGKKKFYTQVLINGKEVVAVGDCVALCPENPSVPSYIAQIMYMWEDQDGKKKFHGKWFW